MKRFNIKLTAKQIQDMTLALYEYGYICEEDGASVPSRRLVKRLDKIRQSIDAQLEKAQRRKNR